MTAKNTVLKVIRADKLEVGRNYTVQIHGQTPKTMTLREKPSNPISKMTADEAFVFTIGGGAGRKEIRFNSHTAKGPKFLVTRVPGARRDNVSARVTFLVKVPVDAEAKEATKKAA